MVIVINLIPNGTVTSETTKRHRAYAMQAITLVNFAENYDETVNLSSKTNETGLMRLSKTSYSYEECASIANKINPNIYAPLPNSTSFTASGLTSSPIMNIDENAHKPITIYNTILIDFVLLKAVNVRIIIVAIRQSVNKIQPNL